MGPVVTISTRSGEFHYACEDRDEALGLLAEWRKQEERRRPREHYLGRDRWMRDHPRQRSIYPATFAIKAA